MAFARILSGGTIEQLGGGTTSTTNVSAFKSIGSTTPNTTGWTAGDLWFDTTSLSTSVAATIRYWDGAQFLPTPGGGSGITGTVLLSDDFTGTDNAVWNASKWVLGRNASSGTGGGAYLLSGTGVLQTSNLGGYNAAAAVARKANITSPTDVNLLCSFKYDSTESYFDINVRHDTDTVDGNNCYSFRTAGITNSWTLNKQVAYSSTLFGSSQSFSYTIGTWYKVRFQAIGTTIRARVWAASGSEPGTWPVSVTDSTYTSGKIGLVVRGGSAAVSSRIFIDDLVITNA